MVDAEAKLNILRDVDRIADSAAGLEELEQRLALWLKDALDADEVVVTRTGPAEDLALAKRPETLRPALERLAARQQAWEREVENDWLIRPLRPDNRTVGLVAVKKAAGLSDDDLEKWGVFDERADSAVLQAIEREALRDRTRELLTIYEIDHIRDEHLEFGEMLQRIMKKVLELVPADCAIVALKELHASDDELLQFHARAREGGRESTMRFLRDGRVPALGLVERAFERRGMLVEEVGEPAREAVCMPLILDEEILGGFVIATEPGERFTTRHRRLFQAVCSQADTAIFEDVARQRIKNVFKRYVSRDVFAELLKRDDEDFLKGRRRDVTVFFSDLRGFTTVSEQLDVDVVVNMLNEHLEAMSNVVFGHGGTVDKFIGDCVMAFFGAPLYQPDHALRAVRCACAMRDRHNEIAKGWHERGLPEVKIGVGMHSGEVFVGNIGGESLISYTVIGDHVNLAARLEGESGPDDVIISEHTLALVKDHVEVEARGEVIVKGKSIPAKIYNVLKVD